MNPARLSIGQMAQLNHISEQTLRLYDREGLLTPDYTDPETGYRYYTVSQSAQLDIIQTMKLYGMTLKEIKQYFDYSEDADILHLLVTQKDLLQQRIDSLENSMRSIDRRIWNMERLASLPQDSVPFLQYIPARNIYIYKTGENYFDEQSAFHYELMLRELKTHFLNENIPMTDFCNVGTIMRKDAFVNGDFYSDEVFVYMDEDAQLTNIETMPSSMYYCVCSKDMDEELKLLQQLRQNIFDAGYEIVGDYYCEVITDMSFAGELGRKITYMIQIPVHFNESSS